MYYLSDSVMVWKSESTGQCQCETMLPVIESITSWKVFCQALWMVRIHHHHLRRFVQIRSQSFFEHCRIYKGPNGTSWKCTGIRNCPSNRVWSAGRRYCQSLVVVSPMPNVSGFPSRACFTANVSESSCASANVRSALSKFNSFDTRYP